MKKGLIPRILVTLLGIGLIFMGVSQAILGFAGKSASALITDIRREGGERTDGNSSNRYKTVYAYNKADDTNEANYNLNKAFKGDAMFETSSGIGKKSWFGDESSFMFGNAVFLHRGGSTINDPGVGIFTFSNTPGMPGNPLGFRCAIIVK